MITLIVIKDLDEIKPLLWFVPNSGHIWVKIEHEDTTVGILELQPLTNLCVSLHLHLFKKHQRKGIANLLEAPLVELGRQLNLSTIIAMVPETNIAVNKVLQNTSFIPSAILANGIYHDKTVQNLLIYIRTI